MTSITGRIAVVTGGASGVGRGIASNLVERGARVAIADIDLTAATEVAAEIGATPFQADVSSRASMDRLAIEVCERLGPVGILVNNAGVTSLARLVDMTEQDWAWLLGVNLLGIANGVSAFHHQLRETRGHILNTGSLSGFAASPTMGGYGTTKFAMTAYTEVLAAELAEEGIGVTLFAPGSVRTSIGTSSRNRPDESRGALRDQDLTTDPSLPIRWLDPLDVGRVAVDAIEADRLYAMTRHERGDTITRRHREIEAAMSV
jgi:NAD(P)-dependent dehydrogenase (short-subunit alcohol dehydrogenase family)